MAETFTFEPAVVPWVRYANAHRKSPVLHRFYKKIRRDPGTNCWNWVGHVNKVSGYGQMGVDRKVLLTHRWAYENWKGPIPEGYHVDHTCNNRRCCNPQHLEAVTQAENNRRAYERKSLCRNGLHPKVGLGTCRECELATNRRGNRRFRAQRRTG